MIRPLSSADFSHFQPMSAVFGRISP